MFDGRSIIKKDWEILYINFNNFQNVLKNIPSNPGLYNIYTDADIEDLKKVGERECKTHYNFTKKIIQSETLPEINRISKTNNDFFIIYNGHHSNLKQRAREHFRGSKGTYCLAIFELKNMRNFNWKFEYLNKIENYSDSKVYRTYLEQAHRIKTGWPILCSQ